MENSIKVFFFLAVISYFFLAWFYNKNIKFPKAFSGNIHQLYAGNSSVFLLGGLCLFIFYATFFDQNVSLLASFFLIFAIGFCSDIGILKSPLIRFFFQLLSIALIIFTQNLQIINTDLRVLDYLLNFSYFNVFFTLFCILILINGTNFIDGLNGLVIGYYITIILILLNLDFNFTLIGVEADQLKYLLYFLTILLILNFFNFLYLGDSGAYLISSIFGFILIKIHNNEGISSFFIILLLWYPCFENLFSIIRKIFISKISPGNPDSSHLHQLLFSYIQKKTIFKKKIYANNLSSISINLFNFLSIYIGSGDMFNNRYQISIILFNILIYCFLYRNLRKN